MALPNPGMDFVPYDVLTAEELDQIVENVEALAAGTGFNTGAIPTAAIANLAVTTPKIADGAVTFAKTSGMGWEELARTTLGVSGDTITVSSIPARRYLHIFFWAQDTGGTINFALTFNNDTGSNYAYRQYINYSSASSATSQSSISLQDGTGANPIQAWVDIANFTSEDKMFHSTFVRSVHT